MYNLIKFLYNYKTGKINTSNIPLEASIELTNVCNFRCKFCPQSNPNHFKKIGKSYLSIKDTVIILKKLRDFGYKRDLIHWTLDGEPFMNKNFHKIFKIAKDYGFTEQYFATNGLFLTKDTISKLPANINYTFCIDFCESPEYFEKFRGTKGSWSKIKNNIDNILNDSKLQNIKIELHDIKLFSINNQTAIKKSFSALKSLFKKSKRISYIKKSFHSSLGFVKEMNSRPSSKYHLCPYPWSSIIIASNGDVVACCRDLEHATVVGNILKQSISEIWNGNKMFFLRSNLNKQNTEVIAACRNCDLMYDDKKFSLYNKISTLYHRLRITAGF